MLISRTSQRGLLSGLLTRKDGLNRRKVVIEASFVRFSRRIGTEATSQPQRISAADAFGRESTQPSSIIPNDVSLPVPPIIGQLSEEQMRVVWQENDAASAIVIAGPGTGKSFCLAARVVYLTMVKRVPGHEILVLADNVDYLTALIDYNTPISHNTAVVRSFGQLARSILKEFYGEEQQDRVPVVLNRPEQLAFFETLRKTNKVTVPQDIIYKYKFEQLMQYFSMMTASGITPTKYDQIITDKFEHDLNKANNELRQQRMDDKQIRMINQTRIDSVETHRKLAAIYTSFRTAMRKDNKTDAADLLQFVLQLLEDHPDFKSIIQKRYQYIMIDNVQTMSEIQLQLLRVVSGIDSDRATKPIFSVFGDDDQSILSFKPVKADVFKAFAGLLPDAALMTLTTSFRSYNQEILDAARRLISQGKGRLETTAPGVSKHIKARPTDQMSDSDQFLASLTEDEPTNSIQVRTFDSEDAEEDALASSISSIFEAHQLEQEIDSTEGEVAKKRAPSICVIVRTKKQAADLCAVLRQRGVPVSINTAHLRESPEIRFMMNFLLLLVQPTTASDALYELIAAAGGPYAMPAAALGRLTEQQIGTEKSLRQLVDEFVKSDTKEKILLQAKKKADRLLGDLDFFERQLKTRSTSQILHGLLKRTQLLQAARNPSSSEDEDVARHIAVLLRICSDIESKMKLSRVADVLPVLQRVLERSSAPSAAATTASATRASGEVIGEEEEPGFVKVLTPWSAATSEFDYIFVPRSTEDRYPGIISRSELASMMAQVIAAASSSGATVKSVANPQTELLEEQRRLFYVMITRARKKVTISYSSSNSTGHSTKPSRFISQLVNLTPETTQASRVAQRAAAALRTMQSQSSAELSTNKKDSSQNGSATRQLFGSTDKRHTIQHLPSIGSVDVLQAGWLISSYLRCPMQYYLENVLKLPVPHKSNYQVFQLSLAASRDWITGCATRGELPNPETAAKVFTDTWRKLSPGVVDDFIPPEIYENAMTMIEKWVDWDLDVGMVASKVAFKLDFSGSKAEPIVAASDTPLREPVPIEGVIDRIYPLERVSHLLVTPAEVAPRTSRELADVAQVLALGYTSVYGSAPRSISVEFVNKHFELEAYEYKPITDDVLSMKPAMASISSRVASGLFQANSAHMVCRRCAFKESCPSSSTKPATRASFRPKKASQDPSSNDLVNSVVDDS